MKQNDKMKKAFTLAEVMITLTVIGVIAAVSLPVAMRSKPDENIMKFKKAHATLYRVIGELISSDKYYKDGDFSIKSDGSFANKSYFCNSIADLLSTKKVVCNYSYSGTTKLDLVGTYYQSGEVCKTLDEIKEEVDDKCKRFQPHYDNVENGIGITTTDNIVFYELGLNTWFGCQYKSTQNPANNCSIDQEGWIAEYRIYGYEIPGDEPGSKSLDIATQNNGLRTLRQHKVFCIDLDGFPKNSSTGYCDDDKDVCPFGYAIRADGKIIPGNRAEEWIKKTMTEDK